MFENNTFRNKATTIRILVNLKYINGKNMAEHTSDFQGLVNQLVVMMPFED